MSDGARNLVGPGTAQRKECPNHPFGALRDDCVMCLQEKLEWSEKERRELGAQFQRRSDEMDERIEMAYQERDDARAQLAAVTDRGSRRAYEHATKARVFDPDIEVNDDDRAAARLLSWARVYNPTLPPGTPDLARWSIGGIDLTFNPELATETRDIIEAHLAACFAQYRMKVERWLEVRRGR